MSKHTETGAYGNEVTVLCPGASAVRLTVYQNDSAIADDDLGAMILLRPHQARTLAEWLNRYAAEADTLSGKAPVGAQIQTLLDFHRDIAEIVEHATLSWEHKYDFVFSETMAARRKALAFNIEWCDPDSDYEDDVLAFFRALDALAKQLRGDQEGGD